MWVAGRPYSGGGLITGGEPAALALVATITLATVAVAVEYYTSMNPPEDGS
jgi:hypothetical protein